MGSGESADRVGGFGGGVGVVTEASFRLKFTKSYWFAMSIISQAFPSPADATGSQSPAVELWVPALGDKQVGTRLEGESPVFPLPQWPSHFLYGVTGGAAMDVGMLQRGQEAEQLPRGKGADQEPAGGAAPRAPVRGAGRVSPAVLPASSRAGKPDCVALGWRCRAVAAAGEKLGRAGTCQKDLLREVDFNSTQEQPLRDSPRTPPACP